MTRDIQRRLRKLESLVPRQVQTEPREITQLRWFLIHAVAYYVGGLKREESSADGYMRALGYSHGFEFDKALKERSEDFLERMSHANRIVLQKFGVSWGQKWDDLMEAFMRMEAGFPEWYKERCRRLLKNKLLA